MKKSIEIICIAIIAIALFSCKGNKNDKDQTAPGRIVTVTDRIVSDAQIMNNNSDDDPWKRNIEGPQRDKFINLIFDAVQNNKIKIYDKDHKEVKYADVMSHLISFDTIKTTGHKNKKIIDEVIVSNSFNKSKISQIRFDEKWTMNDRTFEIKKEVYGFCPVMAEFDEFGTNCKYQQPLFWVYADTTKKDTTNNNYVITKMIQYETSIKAKEKSSEWWLNNIEPSQRDTLINSMINAVLNNKLKAYDYLGNPMTKELFNNYFNRTDTVVMDDPATGAQKLQIIKQQLDNKSVVKMRFIEEWSIDTKTFKFTKKVLALSPITELNDAEGNFKAWMALFTIYFDNSLIPSQKQ